jgi:2-polyprenyl-3-methyl-5-hydroxy-6-metoxy-1,4-benzoquinol methylase
MPENLTEVAPRDSRRVATKLSARVEPFDSYWQAPEDVERGYRSFATYYEANILPQLPESKSSRILVVSCGPGYLVDTLIRAGYTNVQGIDSDPAKIAFAEKRALPCESAEAFPFLAACAETFDVIVGEQELNHLTLDESQAFLKLCHKSLKPGGRVVVYAVNSANPLVGSEGAAGNIDHFYTVTEHSMGQIMTLGGFENNKVFPLKLYVFYNNPLNYIGLATTVVLESLLRLLFKLYGKKVAILTKKIGATGFKL